jgi:hypothetical protein
MVIRYSDVVIDRTRLTIGIGAYTYKFTNSNGPIVYRKKDSSVAFETITYLLLNGHSTRQQLFDLIYGHDKEGGPIDGADIFSVHFHNWKHIFDALHLELRREWQSGKQFVFLRFNNV